MTVTKFTTAGAFISCAILMVLGAMPAGATPLAPGTASPGPPPDIFTTTPSSFVAFTGDEVLTPTFEAEEVVFSDPSNPFGAGDLDFGYQFAFVHTTSPGDVQKLIAGSFAGFSTDVGYNPNFITDGGFSGTIVPSSVDRPDISGDTVEFNFPAGAVTAVSPVLQIDTNATLFTAGTASVLIDGGSINFSNAFAPAAVPDPSSLVLFSIGLGALALYARKIWPQGRTLKHRG